MKLCQIIRQARVDCNMTLPEVSKKTGLSKGLLSKLENDPSANPTLSTLLKISKLYGRPLFFLSSRIE